MASQIRFTYFFTHIREVFRYSNLKNVYLHSFLG